MTYRKDKMWVAVDCLVFGYDVAEESLNVLLFKRQVNPFAGEWSLIGGFVDADDSLSTSATKVLERFTGLNNVFLEQLSTFGQVDRDPGGRVISVLYWSLIKLDQPKKETVGNYKAGWFAVNQLPELIMDHTHMVKYGMASLQDKARRTPIGFELLPKEFTLPVLRRLYEAIYQQPLDDRNFRKKILATGICQRLDKKDRSTSKKGAYLYEFDEARYRQLHASGIMIDFF